ncbi:uncharacterized protein SPPG_06887 [Spizellomyces punctatus DAOM BR117]|uniref:Uncharacterized protein n=1 Tax=Spizellomyces punctatus (strain DAOM BR117) TaxID=645134 RepID=A0A0L0HA59_SPIPD|nr:uncharacterized protein SPPG_06887 [Spizellomyces punctatus DAOM BR117]KNC97896.1 hypothetical protein SPPG_06887 [Spizellomyces punctatus DAOM BR117]|eukprot:XP_016605936.1 hypothetical protein SPPG_06887 [Spizellomyces punctatus DAOM BR117]
MPAIPLAVQLGTEALSILALYGVYTQSQHHFPPGPYGQVMAGATAGTALALTAMPFNTPIFPETSVEHRAGLPGQGWRNVAKAASGYACFFAVAEGLRTGIYKARLVDASRTGSQLPPRSEDPQWHLTNFFAGGVAGLAYRAATLPFFKGPLENPLLTKSGVGILIGTFVAMGSLMTGFGWADTAFNLEVHPEKWGKVEH